MQRVATESSATWWHPDVTHYMVFWECVDCNYEFFTQFLYLKSSMIECCHAKYHVITRDKWHRVIYSITMRGTNTIKLANLWFNVIHLMRELTIDEYIAALHVWISWSLQIRMKNSIFPLNDETYKLICRSVFPAGDLSCPACNISCSECLREGNEPPKSAEAVSLVSLEKYSEKFMAYMQLRISIYPVPTAWSIWLNLCPNGDWHW